MTFRQFVAMYKRIEASIREQRPEMSNDGVEDLVYETLRQLREFEPKRRRKARATPTRSN